MIRILNPCPSCGNREFEISDGNATCTSSKTSRGWNGCGKIWRLSKELRDKFGEEE